MSTRGPGGEALAGLHADLPATYDLRFLNYAATAPMLAVAADAIAEVTRENLRPLSEHFPVWLERVERARRVLAETFGAGSDEITFTSSTSTALSLAAASVRWRPGDRVLYPADEFPSNRFVWDNLRDLGVRAEALAPEPGVAFANQLARTDLTGVRLVAFSAVSFRDGRRLHPAAVAAVCRPLGILTCVDAIQAVGAIPLSLREWDCDFAACGGQKWLLGPVGSGFLFVRRGLLDTLHVPTVGWASSRHAGDHDAPTLSFCDGAARFEAGLPDVAAIAGLAASVRRLDGVGWPIVHARVAELRTRLAEGLRSRGLTLLHDGDAAECAGIATARVSAEQTAAIADAFAGAGVIATLRSGELRVSAHATTSDGDVSACLDAVERACGRAASITVRPAATTGAPTDAATEAPGGPSRGWSHALVTGASRGLGAAIAETLAARGTRLTLLARDPAALGVVAARIAAAHPVEIRTAQVDLADGAALTDWLTRHRDELRDVDLLVNNAAQAEAAPFLELEEARIRATFATNLFAPMTLARALLPAMLERRRGHLLNIVTSGARNALPLFSSYASSKGALWAWSESLARELDGTGVAVTTFVPPHMETATSNQLARRAVGWYDARGHTQRKTPTAAVAAMALAAAAQGRRLVAPTAVRWQLALNAVAAGPIERAIRRRWKRS
ncbi:MAG: SDR family NAD(P)-dependent oxidoreductase [Candidatus Eisenbacteria bacterium]